MLNACPQARAAQEEFYVVPLDVVTLDGSPSIDQDGPNNRPVSYEWIITNRPDHSISQPHESFFDPAQPPNGGTDDDYHCGYYRRNQPKWGGEGSVGGVRLSSAEPLQPRQQRRNMPSCVARA